MIEARFRQIFANHYARLIAMHYSQEAAMKVSMTAALRDLGWTGIILPEWVTVVANQEVERYTQKMAEALAKQARKRERRGKLRSLFK